MNYTSRSCFISFVAACLFTGQAAASSTIHTVAQAARGMSAALESRAVILRPERVTALVAAVRDVYRVQQKKRLDEKAYRDQCLSLLSDEPFGPVLQTSFELRGSCASAEFLKDLFTRELLAGNFRVAEKLLRADRSVIFASNVMTDQASLLHHVSRTGNVAAARFLLAHGADVNSRDQEGKTPLMHAASPDLFELLLQNNSRVGMLDASGASVLYHLVARRAYNGFHRDADLAYALRACIERGALANETGKPELLLHRLIEDEKYLFFTPLKGSSNLAWLQFFIEHGFPLDAVDHQKATALDYAHAHRFHGAVQALEAKGAPFYSKILEALYAFGIPSARLLYLQK